MADFGEDVGKSRLLDAIILSVAVYSKNPKKELQKLSEDYGLAPYEFLPDDELDNAGLSTCKQSLLVVQSSANGHYIVACRGTRGIRDALVDLKILQRTMSLGDGAAHAGFLDRAKTVPLLYLRKLLLQNEKIILTGHSLGGAVASLLTLRLLESSGKWCHEQIQCYTFGCPFFADYRLANYINSRYKQHFVHLVSCHDLVPKAIPIVYTLYSLWGGLYAGPLADLLNCSKVFVLGLRVMKVNLRFCQQNHLIGMASEALSWLPTLSQLAINRLLALAISFHAGDGYSFAGHLMLLNSGNDMFQIENRQKWTLNTLLRFHFGGISLKSIKKHRLRSYLEHIFPLQAEKELATTLAGQQLSGTATLTFSDVTTHITTLVTEDVDEELGSCGNDSLVIDYTLSDVSEPVKNLKVDKRKGVRAFKKHVACVIFTKRLQEALTKKKKTGSRARPSLQMQRMSRFPNVIHQLGMVYLGFSALCSLHKFSRIICRT